MKLRTLRAALEALARKDPMAFELPLAHPVVVAALAELERQEGRRLEYYPCPAAHPERWPLAKYFDTSAELFLHLLSCEQFAEHVRSPQPTEP